MDVAACILTQYAIATPFPSIAHFHWKSVTFETEGNAWTAHSYFTRIGGGRESKADFLQNVLQDSLCLQGTPKLFAHGVQCQNYTECTGILAA